MRHQKGQIKEQAQRMREHRVSFAAESALGHTIDVLEAQLRDFYFVFAPERCEYAAEVAAAYCNDVDALNEALLLKYGVCLFQHSLTASTLTTADNPTFQLLLHGADMVEPIFPSGDDTAAEVSSNGSPSRKITPTNTHNAAPQVSLPPSKVTLEETGTFPLELPLRS